MEVGRRSWRYVEHGTGWVLLLVIGADLFVSGVEKKNTYTSPSFALQPQSQPIWAR